MISGSTVVYLLIADPIGHVRLDMFNDHFDERGIDMVMIPVHVGSADLPGLVAGCRGWRNLAGIGVTVPHKERMASLVDSRTTRAAVAGAVNVVRRHADGRFEGDNVDGIGFVTGFRERGHDPAGAHALIVGAGGAARSVALALAAEGAARVDVANRTRARAEELVARLRRHCPAVTADVVAADPAGYTLVVNCTTLGMHAGDALPVDPTRIDRSALVAEVVMSPDVTPLLEAARARGIAVHEGRHMLAGQLTNVVDFLLQRG